MVYRDYKDFKAIQVLKDHKGFKAIQARRGRRVMMVQA